LRYGSVGVGAYAHSVNFEAESRKRNNSLDADAWIDAGVGSCFDMIFDVGLALPWHCKPGDRLDPSYMRIVAASAIRLHEASVISTAAFEKTILLKMEGQTERERNLSLDTTNTHSSRSYSRNRSYDPDLTT